MGLFKKSCAERFNEKYSELKEKSDILLLDINKGEHNKTNNFFDYIFQIRIMELFVSLFPEIIQTKATFSKTKILESIIAFQTNQFERFMHEKFPLDNTVTYGGKKHTLKVKKTKHSSKRTKYRK